MAKFNIRGAFKQDMKAKPSQTIFVKPQVTPEIGPAKLKPDAAQRAATRGIFADNATRLSAPEVRSYGPYTRRAEPVTAPEPVADPVVLSRPIETRLPVRPMSLDWAEGMVTREDSARSNLSPSAEAGAETNRVLTLLGEPGKPVPPGQAVDTTTGELHDIPDIIDSDAEMVAQAEQRTEPTPEPSWHGNHAEAVRRATEENNGEAPTQKQINKHAAAIGREIRQKNREKKAAEQKQQQTAKPPKQSSKTKPSQVTDRSVSEAYESNPVFRDLVDAGLLTEYQSIEGADTRRILFEVAQGSSIDLKNKKTARAWKDVPSRLKVWAVERGLPLSEARKIGQEADRADTGQAAEGTVPVAPAAGETTEPEPDTTPDEYQQQILDEVREWVGNMADAELDLFATSGYSEMSPDATMQEALLEIAEDEIGRRALPLDEEVDEVSVEPEWAFNEQGDPVAPLVLTDEQAEARVAEIASAPQPTAEQEAEAATEIVEELLGEEEIEDVIADGSTPWHHRQRTKAEEGPVSEAFKRVITSRAGIRRAMIVGRFRLKGDRDVKTPLIDENGRAVVDKNNNVVMTTKLEHSQDVIKEMKKTFEFFGHEWDPDQAVWLFRAFQVYRGFSPDRDQQIFNKAPKDVAISDEVFITFLKEIRENVVKSNHPFAHNNPHYTLAGSQRLPIPTTPGLAEWFTSGSEKSKLALSPEGFVRYSMENHINRIEELIESDHVSDAQREVLFDMVDVVAEEWGDHPWSLITPRSVNSRIGVSEYFDPESEFALLYNTSDDLKLFMRDQALRSERARVAMEKLDKRRGKNRTQRKLTPDPDMKWYEKFAPEDSKDAARKLSKIARLAGITGMVPLAITAAPEHAIGLGYQSAGQKVLNWVTGSEQASEESLDTLRKTPNLYALDMLMGLMAEVGPEGMIDMANQGVRFTAMKEPSFFEKALNWGISLSIGTVAFKKVNAKLFMNHLIYQFDRSNQIARRLREKNPSSEVPIINVTRVELEAMLANNPDAFWNLVATTKEGRAAVHFAANASLAGTDPMSAALKKATANPITDFTLGFITSHHLKFGIRSVLRMIPFSHTLTYIVKKGLVNPARLGLESQGLLAEGSTEFSNEHMLGGNEGVTLYSREAMEGLGQVIAVDMMRFGSQLTTYAVATIALYLMGGLEPPDDEELDHLWYEWKLGGVPMKENWYWMELLGFAMPLAAAINIAKSTGDIPRAKKVLVHGLWDELEEGTWMNVADTIDLFTRFDEHLQEAQNRAETNLNGAPERTDYGWTAFGTFMARRAYQSFEPSAIRALYNEAGLDFGRQRLARSTGQVFTTSVDDDPSRTTPTTWNDQQWRRLTMNSPTAGFIGNILSGYYINNGATQKTGYMRDNMPLITNADPYQSEIMRDLLVMDDEGNYVPIEKWPPDRKLEIANTVIDYVTQYDGAQLAADGVVIPFDARKAANALVFHQMRIVKAEYNERVQAGEFHGDYVGKNIAWEAKDNALSDLWDLREKIWNKEIPSKPAKYNRWVTSYRPLFVWKEGTPKAGQPATKMDWRFNRDEVEFSIYASGDHKSSFAPFLFVDDGGHKAWDHRTPLVWQNQYTDFARVKERAQGNIISAGMNEGEDLWDLVSGSDAITPGTYNGKLVLNSRAYIAVEDEFEEIPEGAKDYGKDDDGDGTGTGDYNNSGITPWAGSWARSSSRRYGYSRSYNSGSSGGGYMPNIYSKPAYSLNVDKPATMYSKNQSFARFDYLRPSVQTKGSREAYRREDF